MDTRRQRPISEHPLSSDGKYSGAMHGLGYDFYREINHDGNCLYSSFACLVYPFLAVPERRQAFLGLTPLFEGAGASPVAYETYIELLGDLGTGQPMEDLSEDEWNLFIGYLRMAVASHLRVHAEEYAGFIPGSNIEAYAAMHVDPMGERAGEVEIIALSRIFDYRIEVVSVREDGCAKMSYGREADGAVTILHTPDHFEPLYRGGDRAPAQHTTN